MAGTNPKSSTSSSSFSAARAFPRFCMIAHLVVCLCAPAYGGGGGAGEDYEQEQEMEVEALQAILMDDIKGSLSFSFSFFNLPPAQY